MAERIGAQVLPTTRQQQEQLVVHLDIRRRVWCQVSGGVTVDAWQNVRFIPESGRCAVQPEISALGQKRNQLACGRRARAAPFNQKL